ncbi:MAG TPA: PEP-CTERM system histidine kinase PrsK [Gammaproteobacteria bacterium]|nr:PEP-CTERM system histidine kinase PrsK [Gammaproteobacteria bacterium]
MTELGLYSYGSAALAFLVLSLLLLTSWRGRAQGAILAFAAFVTCIWAGVLALFSTARLGDAGLPRLVELLKYVAWYVFLFRLLRAGNVREFRVLTLLLSGLCAVLAGLYLFALFHGRLPDVVGENRLTALGNALLAVGGLVLVEQLFRNTPEAQRWGIKYLCLGVGGMFAYDFYLYADMLLFGHVATWTWDARGLVYALVVPLVMVSAARNPQWSLDVYVSRRIVFYGAALLAAGIYLLVMAAGGAYIRYYGGSWGAVMQIVFIFGALLVLVVILSSGHARAYLRVFLNKHFFNYKYDYRDEWLGFIRKLSFIGSDPHWRERAIQALADIVDSPGGVLLERDESGNYVSMAHFSMPEPGCHRIPPQDPLICFLADKKWVVNLEEFNRAPQDYPGLRLPPWLTAMDGVWLAVPLVLEEELVALVLLARPLAAREYSWEDNDILKTAGTQVAGFLIQQRATQELINARQFEATNRLAAFMMHDLKNIMAQLALLLSNAEKHKHNPAFVDDMIATVANATNRMGRMLEKLGGDQGRAHQCHVVDMVSLLREAVETLAGGRPQPVLEIRDEGVHVRADEDRLCAVLAHVIRNAQEATSDDGHIEVVLSRAHGQAVVEIRDNGKGMDRQFVREHLFRPFDSTKGSSGMGIGAYECREYVRELGGEVEVESEPGRGTLFRIRLPLSRVDSGAPASSPGTVVQDGSRKQ